MGETKPAGNTTVKYKFHMIVAGSLLALSSAVFAAGVAWGAHSLKTARISKLDDKVEQLTQFVAVQKLINENQADSNNRIHTQLQDINKGITDLNIVVASYLKRERQ